MKAFLRSLIVLLLALVLLVSLDAPAMAAGTNGVWVSTIYSLDYPTEPGTNARKLASDIDAILDGCQRMGMDTVFFQVRPAADAFYKSDLYPWSAYLCGEQGLAPKGGFDPLAYFVKEAHARGMELHAWINPFRAAISASAYAGLSADSPALQHPEWVIEYNGGYYFDPGLPEVRSYIVAGVEEILRNYDVDGIHFDDYFYPGLLFPDAESFAAYGGDYTEVADWRRANVNDLVRSVGRLADKYDVEFGISPSGIWANARSVAGGSDTAGNQHYVTNSADSVTWIKKGWVDYICPQIYWPIGYEIADYAKLVDWWQKTVRGTGVKLYIGMADYRYATGAWTDLSTLTDQLDLNAKSKVDGAVHFRYRLIRENSTLYSLYCQRAQRASARFRDVPAGAWYENDLTRLLQRGLIGGVTETSFAPAESSSRAMVVTVLWRMAGSPETTAAPAFTDLTQSWYRPAVAWAAANEVTGGVSPSLFAPDKPVTREQLVSFLYRYRQGTGKSVSFDEDALDAFSDVAKVSPYAKDALCWAVSAGVIGGETGNRIDPQGQATRAQLAVILERYCSLN